jgi:transcriptional regulator GlxA family with amidase domain
MVTVSILILRRSLPACIADARYVFTIVNHFLEQSGQEPLFKVQLVGSSRPVPIDDVYLVRPDLLLDESFESELIIIPALSGDMITATHINRDYGYWIAQQYKNGAEVASLCTGAFLLAFSGILKNRECTTHWKYANEFRLFYPSVKLVDEKVLTHQNGVYSSGGSNAYWNLLIHLVEKYAGREMAILTAKYFVIDFDRHIQTPFIVFNGLKDHGDNIILRAQAYIEENYGEKLTVDELAAHFNTTRRTFERRFKKATRNTVTEYIQRVKIEAAKKQLESGRKNVTDVMFDVGYIDHQAFRDAFKKITGMTPVDYLHKYS